MASTRNRDVDEKDDDVDAHPIVDSFVKWYVKQACMKFGLQIIAYTVNLDNMYVWSVYPSNEIIFQLLGGQS